MLVSDVRSYETMKLRLLNGSHSLLAYTGYLMGCEYISDAMSNTKLVGLVKRFMDKEVTPTLIIPEGFDLEGYKVQLRDRFKNPALKHRTRQVAMDGSQKLPQRIAATIRDQLATAGDISVASFALAAWLRYVKGIDEQGEPIDVQDPMADRLAEAWRTQPSNYRELVKLVLEIEVIFGAGFASDDVIAQVSKWLIKISDEGMREAVNSMLAG